MLSLHNGVTTRQYNERGGMAIHGILQKGETAMATATVHSPAQQSERESSEILHEQIAALAYALWQERGCPEGSPEEDWFTAEKELSA
jgi:DUF2934 family protein